jgi:hypothetical protein
MKLREIDSFDLSSRTSVQKGDVVRLSRNSGPYYLTEDGRKLPLTLPGLWLVVAVLESTRGGSTFLEVSGLDKTAGTFTVKVRGKTTVRNGVHWRPFRVFKRRGGLVV